MTDTPQEEKIQIENQWFYRGNKSPSWFALASRADGSASGIAEKMPAQTWHLLSHIAIMQRELAAARAELAKASEPAAHITRSGIDRRKK